MEFLGKTITGIIALFIASFFGGWGLSVLWGWYVVPLFSAPALGVAPAIGLTMTVRWITGYSEKENDEYESYSYAMKIFYLVFASVVKALVAVFVGWIVLQFV